MPKPSRSIHVHLHVHPSFQSTSGEVHLHLHGPGAESAAAEYAARISGPIETEAISLPSEGVGWPVRPDGSLSSGLGFICLYGFSDAANRDSVWGKAFDHAPTSAEIATVPTDGSAVQGLLFTSTGELDFKFDHLSNEIKNVRHSSGGVQNWVVVWVKNGDTIVRTFTSSFRGVTAAQTFCELLSGGHAAFSASQEGGIKFDDARWQKMIRNGGEVAAEVPGA